MKLAMRFATWGVALVALGVTSVSLASEAPKRSSAPAKSVLSPAGKPYREYYIYVLTTESRIPKRYIYRFSSEVTTASPVVMYFNNNRLQLFDADLTVTRR